MGFRMTENLSVQRTKSYSTDSRIKLGTGAYRRYVTFPFPTSPQISQEGTNQLRVPSMSNNTAGANLWQQPSERWWIELHWEMKQSYIDLLSIYPKVVIDLYRCRDYFMNKHPHAYFMFSVRFWQWEFVSCQF